MHVSFIWGSHTKVTSLFAAHQAPVVGHSYPLSFMPTNTLELGQLNHDRVTNRETPVLLRDG